MEGWGGRGGGGGRRKTEQKSEIREREGEEREGCGGKVGGRGGGGGRQSRKWSWEEVRAR